MSIGSWVSAAAGMLVGGLFVARAASGVPSAWAYREGRVLERSGKYSEAGPMIDRGAIGANRVDALWRAGRSRLESWDEMTPIARSGAPGGAALSAAASRFLAARASAPASAWFLAALGDVYDRRERAARTGRVPDLAALERGPWGLVGDDGRVAIGLARAAIEHEPTRFPLRDQLVLVLEGNGVHEAAVAAMADSARALPDFDAHPAFVFEALPRDLIEAFWRAARAIPPGDAPNISRERQMLSAGQLGRRLGHLAEAEADLRSAMAVHGTPLGLAEDAFHLSLVLVDRGRIEDAEALLSIAAREPVFGPGVAITRAAIAERRELWPEALEHWSELRRLRPRELSVLMGLARVARKAGSWDRAEEALRWAMLVHPDDPAPREALTELLRAKDEAPVSPLDPSPR